MPSRCPRPLAGGELLERRELLAFDPSPIEQAFMESINRMRTDPQRELEVLFTSQNPLQARQANVQAAMDFFDVNDSLLLSQWSQLEPVPPVAWSEQLSLSALRHTELMLQFDEQSHDLPGEPDLATRIRDTGYALRRATENIFAFAEDHLHGHAGFVIDWGEGPGGIQDPPGHRINYMDALVHEAGIAVLSDSVPTTRVGPFLVTQHFGQRARYKPQMVGTVFSDLNANGIYDPGEGHGDLEISVIGTGGMFETRTMSAGGWQLELPPGTYDVFVAGAAIAGPFAVGQVSLGQENVKVDFELRTANRPPTAVADSITVTEDTPRVFSVTTNDLADGGQLVNNSVVITEPPRFGSATVNGLGQIRYEPSRDFHGTDSLRYTVRDTHGLTSNAALVTLTVTPVPDPPVAQDLSGEVLEQQILFLPLDAEVTDPEGNMAWSTLRIVDPPQRGTASVNVAQRRLEYRPPSDHAGTITFTYQVADSTGLWSNVATVTVNVVNINDPPAAYPDIFTMVDGQPLALPVLNNDRDPDSDLQQATIEITVPPARGAAVIQGQQIRYSTQELFVGQDELQYRVRDPQGALSEPATVRIFSVTSANAWQNPVWSVDATGDGVVSPLDALAVINQLRVVLTYPSSAPGLQFGPPPFVDVNGDGIVSPVDAIQVINVLNSPPSAPSSRAAGGDRATAEGEERVSTPVAMHPPVPLAAAREVSRDAAEAMRWRHLDALFGQ